MLGPLLYIRLVYMSTHSVILASLKTVKELCMLMSLCYTSLLRLRKTGLTFRMTSPSNNLTIILPLEV